MRKKLVNRKRDELRTLPRRELVDHILAYPDQDFLNRDEDGKRKYPVGYIAQNVKEANYNMSDAQYYTMLHHFSKIIVPDMRVVGITFQNNDPSEFQKTEVSSSHKGRITTYEMDYLLLPEPTNQFDANAVMILVKNQNTGKAEQIGYLAKEFVAAHPITEPMLIEGTMVDYSNGHFKNVSYRLALDTELLDQTFEHDLNLTDQDLQGIGDLNLDINENNPRIYRTNFSLTRPVNDLDEARAYLSEDITDKLREDGAYIDGIDQVIGIEWVLRNDQFGYVELSTTKELSDEALDAVSMWIRTQNSLKMGPDFAQQDFAKSPTGKDLNIFDWVENPYELNDVTDTLAELKQEEIDRPVRTPSVYRTDFNLKVPVNDFEKARNYLDQPYYTDLLKDDKRVIGVEPEDISHVKWILEHEDSGYVEIATTRELTDEELGYMSKWVRAQNADGIGECFEQQDFAEVYEESDDFYEESEPIMASFDWDKNPYTFYKVEPVVDVTLTAEDLNFAEEMNEMNL